MDLNDIMTLIAHVCENEFGVVGVVVLQPEAHKYFGEILVFFFHLLMVRSALFGLPCFNKGGHRFEDPICPSEVFVKEVLMM